MSSEAYVPVIVQGIDIRLVARRQRWLLWLVLASLCSVAWPFFTRSIPFVPSQPFLVLYFVVYIGVRVAVWVGTILIMRALRTHLVILVLCALLMLVPLINLIILLWENGHATRTLRRVGLRVGFMGVKDEDVVIKLSPNLCHACGYDLTGNVSGRCPECGAVVAATPSAALQAQAQQPEVSSASLVKLPGNS